MEDEDEEDDDHEDSGQLMKVNEMDSDEDSDEEADNSGKLKSSHGSNKIEEIGDYSLEVENIQLNKYKQQ